MKRQRDRERGASLVEFALVLPVFMALVLGMFTGGIAYNRKISLTNASREASRYAATLPVSNYASLDNWLAAVATAAQDNTSGDLSAGTAGRQICVAYMYPEGSLPTDSNRMLVRNNASDSYSTPSGSTACFDDGRTSSEHRVQVKLDRSSDLQVLFFSVNLGLSGRSVTRYEATQ